MTVLVVVLKLVLVDELELVVSLVVVFVEVSVELVVEVFVELLILQSPSHDITTVKLTSEARILVFPAESVYLVANYNS